MKTIGIIGGMSWESSAHYYAAINRETARLRGGLHSAPGRERVLPYLFLSGADRESLKHVAQEGASVTARDLPVSRPVPLTSLLAEGR